ncbi:MAG: SusC/RagA family TonB-linked outer membrane protein [Bacteroidales bacterium]|nr:SusC/RagA family TonB-linked outer membrane protein [Bacteroidales bacterium]
MKNPKPTIRGKNTAFQNCMLFLKLSVLFWFLGAMQVSGSVYSEYPQQNTVSGKITDSNTGELLPGVNIVVEGTTIGAISDVSGKYTIQVPNRNAVLVFSFIGYALEKVPVNGQSIIDINLVSEVKALGEVVVTALGMKKEKKAIGYDVSNVTGDKIATGGVSNALKSLDGKITGVQINSITSSPTSSVMFNIRGATSLQGIMGGWTGNINNQTQPLIVVNGVPVATNTVSARAGIDVGNFMSSIDPNEIESVSILKGASAAALYGSSAGNGVIVITTKDGSKAKKGLGISVNSSTSIDQAYSSPPIQRIFLQGGEEGEPMTDDKKGFGWNIYDTKNNVGNVPRWNLLTQKWEEVPLIVRGDQDPLMAFLKTGVMTENNVAVTGNYDKGNYRLSVTNLDSKSVIPNNRTIRNDVSFSSVYKLNDKLTFTSNASYTNTFVPNQSHTYGKREDNPLAVAMQMPINMPPMSEWKQANTYLDGWEGQYQNTPYLKNPMGDRLGNVNAQGFDNNVGKNNPYFVTNNIIRTYTKNLFYGKVQMDWKIVDPLTFTVRTGLNSENFAFERKASWGAERAQKGAYEQSQSVNLGINTDILLAYNDYFFDKRLNVDALGGVSYGYSESNGSGFGGNELSTPNNYSLSALPASVRQNTSIWRSYPGRSYGAYATVTLGWESMVYLELTGRNDWSGILEYEKVTHFYPGASLSWLASETFKENLPEWVTLLKMRGSYAVTGHGIGQPVNLDSYGISGNVWGSSAMGTIGGNLVDVNIKPELSITKELGVDLGFFQNRISANFTIYQKAHINQIQNLPVVASSGFASMLANMGNVTSDGIEASLTVVPVRNRDWTWSVTGNAFFNKSVITKLDDRFSSKFYGYEAQSMIGLFEGIKVGDLYAQYPIAYIQSGKYKGMALTGPGGIIEESVGTDAYRKKNGYLGNMNPDAILGFSTDLKYKNWNLGVVTNLRLGGIFISETQKILVDDGMADLNYIYKGQKLWTGGRFSGGLPSLPNPDDLFKGWQEPGGGNVQYREFVQENLSLFNSDPRYFGYWNAVFIDPRKDISGLTQEEKINLPDDYYILNGADPNATLYLPPYGMEGNELWSGAQFRTYDATVFKIKEINLTYSFNRSLLAKIHCQDASITFFAKNVMFWAKNRMKEDPETAFRDGVSGMGIAQYGQPPIRSLGVKLSLNF